MVLPAHDERRRSGSHYTPRRSPSRSSGPRLRPILERPRRERRRRSRSCAQGLRPGDGSGAFLVEACRQLGEQLVKAWRHSRQAAPTCRRTRTMCCYARRLVAQRCLYGVDKNPFAVDLAKLSLWLATLARDHPFTFLDHALRHGDSLVGLSREQIASFHWAPEKQVPLIRTFLDKAIAEAMALRAKIPGLANSDDVQEKRRLLRDADDALAKVRLIGEPSSAASFRRTSPRHATMRGGVGRRRSLAGCRAAPTQARSMRLSQSCAAARDLCPAFTMRSSSPRCSHELVSMRSLGIHRTSAERSLAGGSGLPIMTISSSCSRLRLASRISSRSS